MKNKWECKHCGKCCLTIPCIFAQVRYGITAQNKKRCPELAKNNGRYECLLIERDPEARRVLITGDCDDPALAHLKENLDAVAIVREYFPETTAEEAGNILWNYTGFPEFWNIPEDGWTALECLRKQLSGLALERNRQIGDGGIGDGEGEILHQEVSVSLL